MDIHIAAKDPYCLAVRLTLSSGSTTADEVGLIRATPFPRWPKASWRPTADSGTLDVFQPFSVARHIPVDNLIFIAGASPMIRGWCDGKYLNEMIQRWRRSHELHGESAREMAERLAVEASRFSETPVESLGVHVDDPGLSGTAVDIQADVFVGLHIDSRDGQPFSKRAGCRNRYGLNLGPGRREIMFVPWSIGSLMNTTGRTTVSEILAEITEFPVHRLMLNPGEAYIMPAENIIHDGSTELSSEASLLYSAMGRFRIGPADSAV